MLGSKNLNPFVGRIIRNGERQRSFAQEYGHPIGQCVKSKVPLLKINPETGKRSIQEIHQVVSQCAKAYKKHTLSEPVQPQEVPIQEPVQVQPSEAVKPVQAGETPQEQKTVGPVSLELQIEEIELEKKQSIAA